MATGRTSQDSATNMQLPGDVLEGIYTTNAPYSAFR